MLTTADRLAIHERLARYAWALDTGDDDAFADCFAADGELVWDAFDEPATWQGSVALRAFAAFFRSLPTSAGRQHHVSNVVIDAMPATGADDGAGHGAIARSYVAVALRGAGGDVAVTVLGWYDDRLARAPDGAWRLRRRVIRDWAGPVLGRFAGQDGARSVRTRPAALAALFATARPAGASVQWRPDPSQPE